jgi:hypothetical protein
LMPGNIALHPSINPAANSSHYKAFSREPADSSYANDSTRKARTARKSSR